MRIQPRAQKPRRASKTYLTRALDDAITRDALRWDCSKSWVKATALAAFYGIDIITPSDRKRVKR